MSIRHSVAVLSHMACWAASIGAAHAQSPPAAPGQQRAPVGTPVPAGSLPPGAEQLPNPVEMMARIRLLEKRLADFEDRKRGTKKPKPAEAAVAPPPATENAEAPGVGGSSAAAVAKPSIPASKSSDAPKPADASLQASFLYRDTAPTLVANKIEVAADGAYVRNVRAGGSPFTQFDRVFAGTLEARFGVGMGFELGVAVPYYHTTRQTVGALQVEESLYGHGDVRLQAARQLWAPTAMLPGMALSVGVEAPTGLTRYDDVKRIIAIQEGAPVSSTSANPRDQSPFSPFLPSVASRGHWAGTVNAQFFKTFDPVVIFFGIGINQALAREFDGNTFQPGMRFLYNAGLSMALSEHTTVGFQFNGSFEKQFKSTIRSYNDGVVRTFIDPAQESARAKVVVIQRLGDGLYIEPSLTFGLTDDTPDMTLGLGLRKRM